MCRHLAADCYGVPLETKAAKSTHCVVSVTKCPRVIALSNSSSNSHDHDMIPYKKSSKMQKYYYKGETPASQQRDDSSDPEIKGG